MKIFFEINSFCHYWQKKYRHIFSTGFKKKRIEKLLEQRLNVRINIEKFSLKKDIQKNRNKIFEKKTLFQFSQSS